MKIVCVHVCVKVINVTTQHATLSGLIPFASYQVSVKCFPRIDVEHDGNFTLHGYWSKAVYATFITLPDGKSIVVKHCLR